MGSWERMKPLMLQTEGDWGPLVYFTPGTQRGDQEESWPFVVPENGEQMLLPKFAQTYVPYLPYGNKYLKCKKRITEAWGHERIVTSLNTDSVKN